MPNPSNPYLEYADSMLSDLRERSIEIDDARQLPQDLADRMAAGGLYKMWAPSECGGLEASPREACEVFERLATANGSAAWCAFISSTSHLTVAMLGKEWREKVSSNPNVIVTSVFRDSGTAVRSERDGAPGYICDGHWNWGSGSRNSHWIVGALHEVDDNGETVENSPVRRAFFEQSDLELVDNWNVSGLKGTGSSDYIARDVWIPEERMGLATHQAEFLDRPIFRFPTYGLLAISTGAIAIGMAQASLDEVITYARSKTPQGSRRTLSERATLHQEIAVVETELRAARALFYAEIDRCWDAALEGPTDVSHRSAIRTSNWHAVQVSARVIDRMYSAMGGTSVFESSCLQRHFRDVHVVTQHMMNADSVMELAGRVLLGQDEKGIGL